ncbi:uncharacterized protein TNCV_2643131 [Trichonephila clavipes]|nr:uncharacterized protein TNCV_2643131 [Trichonephila clavipes]
MNFFYSKDNLVALHFKYDFTIGLPRLALDVVQSGRPIFDDIFQHLWPYIGNNTANSSGVKSQDLGGQFTGPKREIIGHKRVFQSIDCGTSCVTCCAVLLEPQLLDIVIVQFRNEKVSNHGSIPITIDCNVVAFIVFEEGFHQPIKRTKQSQTPLKKDTDDMPDGEEKGPDIIPANIINRAYYTEDPKESSPSGSTITSRRWPETPPQQSIETSLTTSTYRKWRSSPCGPRPIVPVSVYVTLGPKVKEQMFRSGGQSDAKALCLALKQSWCSFIDPLKG